MILMSTTAVRDARVDSSDGDFLRHRVFSELLIPEPSLDAALQIAGRVSGRQVNTHELVGRVRIPREVLDQRFSQPNRVPQG